MTAPRRVLLVAALAATTLLTGCGSQSATSVAAPPAPGTILNVAQVTDLLRTATSRLTSVHEDLSIDTSVAGITGEGDVTMGAQGLTARMALTVPTLGAVETRLVDKNFYVKMNLPTLGGKWLKVDLSDPNSRVAQMMSSLSAMAPSQIFDQYLGGVQNGTFIGTDTVGDQYEIVVDTSKAIANLPKELADNPMIATSMKSLPAALKINIWQKGGLLQKMVVDMSDAGTITLKLSDFGQAVTVVAPPSAEVTSIPGLG